MEKYLIPFITTFLLTVVFIFLLKFFFGHIKYKGRTENRHIQGKNFFRLGGVAIIMAFNAAIFLNQDLFISSQLYGVMIASLIILAVGIWDDLREISWKIQLFFQASLATLIFFFGIRIEGLRNPFADHIILLDGGIGTIISFVIVLFWIVIMMNSMNWLDGIDGLAGGIFFIGAATLFVLSLRPEVNQPPMAILAMILAGSALGFLAFNSYPALVISGTSGSMFMGFILATLAIFAGTKVATAILVLSLPIIDFVWVIAERIRQRKSIFTADRNHLHYKLLELGWSQRRITLSFYGITLVMAFIALNTRTLGKSIAFTAIFIAIASALFFLNKRLKKA